MAIETYIVGADVLTIDRDDTQAVYAVYLGGEKHPSYRGPVSDHARYTLSMDDDEFSDLLEQRLAMIPKSHERSDYESAMKRLEIYFDKSKHHSVRCLEAYPVPDGDVYPARTWIADARDVVLHLLGK